MALLFTILLLVVAVMALVFGITMMRARAAQEHVVERTLTTSEFEAMIQERVAEAQEPLFAQIEALEAQLAATPPTDGTKDAAAPPTPPSRQRPIR